MGLKSPTPNRNENNFAIYSRNFNWCVLMWAWTSISVFTCLIQLVSSYHTVGNNHKVDNNWPSTPNQFCTGYHGKHGLFTYWMESIIVQHFSQRQRQEEWCIQEWQPIWTVWGIWHFFFPDKQLTTWKSSFVSFPCVFMNVLLVFCVYFVFYCKVEHSLHSFRRELKVSFIAKNFSWPSTLFQSVWNVICKSITSHTRLPRF